MFLASWCALDVLAVYVNRTEHSWLAVWQCDAQGRGGGGGVCCWMHSRGLSAGKCPTKIMLFFMPLYVQQWGFVCPHRYSNQVYSITSCDHVPYVAVFRYLPLNLIMLHLKSMACAAVVKTECELYRAWNVQRQRDVYWMNLPVAISSF